MNILEKIIKEIEVEAVTNHEIGRKQCEGMIKAVRIIRPYMDNIKQVSSAEIIKRFIDEKPYYEIKYKEIGKEEYCFGYGSYNLNYVLEWLNECFEFCEEAQINIHTENQFPIRHEWFRKKIR